MRSSDFQTPTVFTLDAHSRVASWSRACERLFGYRSEEIIGRSVGDLISSEVNERGKARWLVAPLSPDESSEELCVIAGKENRMFQARIVRTTLEDRNGHLLATVSIAPSVPDASLVAGDHYQLLVEMQSEMVSLSTLDGELKFVNAAYARHFDLEPHQLLGRSLYDFIPPGHREAVRQQLNAACATGTTLNSENQMLSAGGQRRWIAWTNCAVRDERGHPIAIHSAGRDITAQKISDERLIIAHERFVLASKAASIGFWEYDLNGGAYRWDEQTYCLHGHPLGYRESAEAILSRVLHTGDRARFEQYTPSQTDSYDCQYRVVHPGGEVRHLRSVAQATREIDGREVRLYGVTMDVTDIVESKTQIAAMVRVNQGLLTVLHDYALVSVTDVAGKITEINDALCTLSGYSRAEMIDQDHRILSSHRHSSEFWETLWRTLQGGQSWRGQICNRSKDGMLYWTESTIAPLLGADGRTEKYIAISTDITTAKITEQQLQASQDFLTRVGEVAGVGGWELDIKTKKVSWTSKTYDIHETEPGYTPTLEAGLSFYSPAARDTITQAVLRSFEDGTGWDLELPVVTAKGREIWVRTVGTAQFEDGIPEKLVGAFQDITARKRIEAQLRETNERFNVAADAAGIGIWEYDVATQGLTWDDWVYRLYGMTRGSEVEPSKVWIERVHPEDQARCRTQIEEALQGRAEFATELRIVRPDGETRYLQVASLTQRGPEGIPISMTGINVDITERKRAELKLLETTSLLQTVLDSASEISIITTNSDLSIASFNSGAERLLGYRCEEIVGSHTLMIFHDPEEVRICAEELSTQQGRRVEGAAVFTDPATHRRSREWTYIRKDGARIPVSLVVTPMYTSAGDIFGYVGMAYDVTRQKQYEASLRTAIENAEHASSAKSEFLANMSHEIRTPLNAVIGLGFLLEQTALSEDQRQLLAKIQFAGRSLLGVVNNVLDLSKVEAGEMKLETEIFNLRELVRDVCQLLRPQAEVKDIPLRIDVNEKLPHFVSGDELRLRQILTNLISNAIKFTQRGEITLYVRLLSVDADIAHLRFEVADTGVGIEPSALQRLFTPFAQADTSTTRRFGGTGLGLSIARQLVELMDGQIGVASVLGEGSTFWVEIPLRSAPYGTSSADSLGGIRIGISEVHDTYGLVPMVQALGWNPTTYASEDALIDYLRHNDPCNVFDVIIIELNVERNSGPSIAETVAEACRPGRAPPIIYIAAQLPSYIADPEFLREEDVILAHPITSSNLFNAINSVLWKKGNVFTHSSMLVDPDTHWLHGVRVLVVDDSHINREVAQRIMQQQGALVATCADGEQAVSYVRDHHESLDIVLMDIQMPVLDGNAASRRIRDELRYGRLPIVALTAGALVAERQRALEAGMNGFISKPFDPQALVRIVRRLVEQARQEPIPLVRVNSPSVDSISPALSLHSIDAAVVTSIFGNDLKVFESLLLRMLKEHAELATPILLAEDDHAGAKRLKDCVHRLKGSAGTLGAMRIMRLADSAEKALSAQPNGAATGDVLRQLAAALRSLRDEAKGLAGHRLERHEQQFANPAKVSNIRSELIALNELLVGQDLAAIDKLELLANQLRQCMSSADFKRLKDAVDELDFPGAAAILAEVKSGELVG